VVGAIGGPSAWPPPPPGLTWEATARATASTSSDNVGVLNPRAVRGKDWALVAVGGITALVGVAGVLIPFAIAVADPSLYDGIFYPLFFSSSTAFVVGTIIFLDGIAGFTEDFVPEATVGSVTAQLVLAAPDSEVGASLRVSF